MSTYFDSASLALIPSGVKDGKAYSIKPTDGSGDFTFSRGTGTATRVNASGLIEKERSNLVWYSNTFSTGWTNITSDETGGQADKDGGNTAWKLDKTAGTGRIEQFGISAGVRTFSVYAKAGTLNWLHLYMDNTGGSTDPRAFFDLQNGVVGTQLQNIDANIESVGGGWYRCSVTGYVSSSFGALIWPCGADNDATGATSGNIYFQDAMVNEGLVAQEYIETQNANGYEGITDNLPRLDYSGGASCPSLLLEPSRTNLCIQSEYAGSWSTNGSGSVTDNAETSPEGLQNAFTLEDTSDSTYFRIERSFTATDGDHTFSVFIKKTTGAVSYYAGAQLDSSRKYVLIDTTNGTWNEAGSTDNDFVDIEDFNADYWRLIIRNDLTAGTIRMALWPALSTDGTSISVGAQGSNSFYGAQAEAASYPTSYIPTYGTAASRAVDLANKFSASDLIGQAEGTMFLDFVYGKASTTNVIFQIRKSTGASRQVDIRVQSGLLRSIGNSDGTGQFTLTYGTPVEGTRYKVAVRYALNDSTMYVNGTQYGTDTSCDFSAGLFEQVTFSEDGSALVEKNSVNQALLFKTPLTNAELAALTTL